MSTTEKRLSRKNALITGGSTGIGLATAKRFVDEGAYSLFNANVKGLLFTVQKALPLMSDGGSIILNASIVASKGFPDWSVYSATKAAVRSFARTLTTDLKDRRIRVNALSPGYIDTPPWRSMHLGFGVSSFRSASPSTTRS